ncbi:MAG: hypothetical protein QXO12_02560 [Candidatus Pacearchaeota archaeon]
MLKKIEKEKRRAQHLFYTSLKYTKTSDIIINLMKRWAATIDETIDACLIHAKKKKIINQIPETPKAKIIQLQKILKNKNDIVKKMFELYEIFKNINEYEIISEHEFRKNIILNLIKDGKSISIDLAKLEEWEKIFENYIKIVEDFLRKK